MEFLLPVALKLFPGMLPSTFNEEKKEVKDYSISDIVLFKKLVNVEFEDTASLLGNVLTPTFHYYLFFLARKTT